MDPLALIIGSAVLAWMVTREPKHAAAVVVTTPVKRKKPRAKLSVKRSIAIVSIDPETKIGRDIMPQGWSYPTPFNEPWINVTMVFA